MTFQIQSIHELNLKPEITVKNSAPLAPGFNLGGLICSHVNSLPYPVCMSISIQFLIYPTIQRQKFQSLEND